MPTLPGKELSQVHYDRVVAAFPGNTAAEKAAAYDAWLTNKLIQRVIQVESAKVQKQADAQLQAIYASLPPLVAEPGDPTQ